MVGCFFTVSKQYFVKKVASTDIEKDGKEKKEKLQITDKEKVDPKDVTEDEKKKAEGKDTTIN